MTPSARGVCAALSLSLLVATFVAVAPAPVNAATVSSAWSARIGSASANGTATLQLYTSGKGSLALKLKKLPVRASLPVTIHKGTCASVGTALVKFPVIKSSSAGAAVRTNSLTAAQVTAIRAVTGGTGKLAIRVGTGKTAKCGLFAALPVQPYVGATITMGRHPSGIAVAPSGVWVTNWGDNTLSRIDPVTNGVLQTLPLALTGHAGPEAIAWGDGSLWVTTTEYDASGKPLAGSLVRVDPASGQVQATIPIGRDAHDIAVTPTAVWVPAYADSTLARIDPATNAVVASIPVCQRTQEVTTFVSYPVGVASGFGSVWASCEDGALLRIDPATNGVVTTIKTQDTGGYVVATPTAIWMTNSGHVDTPDGSVTRVDPATNSVVAKVAVGHDPWAIASAGGSLWIGLYDTPTVVRVSTTTNAVLARVGVAAPVYEIAASDRSVWAVHNPKAPDANTPAPPGKVTRINYFGETQGAAAVTPPTAPTPSPTPSASAVPSPTPTAAAGGTVYTDGYFMLALPAGWSRLPSGTFIGPSGQEVIVPHSAPTSQTLDELSASIVARVKGASGADPEQTEAITLGGASGRMLTYHFPSLGGYALDAFCVHNGRAYEVAFSDVAGRETADRAFFLSVLASFTFMSAG
jgi:YVTN family beta-propeller protein